MKLYGMVVSWENDYDWAEDCVSGETFIGIFDSIEKARQSFLATYRRRRRELGKDSLGFIRETKETDGLTLEFDTGNDYAPYSPYSFTVRIFECNPNRPNVTHYL